MKLFLIGVLTLICSVANAAPNISILQSLQQMNLATKQLNYEAYYVRVSKNNIEPMRYRHAVINGKRYAHFAYLSGPNREIIHRDNEVTYFEPGFDPYTIISEQVMAPLPSISSNFTRLRENYNYVSLGRSREGGLSSEAIRITPKNNRLYSYVIWIDEKTKLLLRSDLLNENGELLEQIRVIKLNVFSSVSKDMRALMELKLPIAIKQLTSNQTESKWLIEALPKGFFPVAHNSYRLLQTARPVENLMFSDGLFSFSIYFSKADELSFRGKSVRNGRRTLYSQIKGNVEVTIVGEISPDVAEKIVKSISLKPTTVPSAVKDILR